MPTGYDARTGLFYETDDVPTPPGGPFDVFLCYNHQDSSAVNYVAVQLKAMGLKPWLDEGQLKPGTLWPDNIKDAIEGARSAAVFVGKSGIGPWQRNEIRAILDQYAAEGRPVIPVLLWDAPEETPKRLPSELQNRQWVDFREDGQALDPIEQLYWGIAG